MPYYCTIYRNHALAAVVVTFPISIFLSKFAAVAIQYLVDNLMLKLNWGQHLVSAPRFGYD